MARWPGRNRGSGTYRAGFPRFEVIRAVKEDDASLKIQNEFYEKSKHPLDTQQ